MTDFTDQLATDVTNVFLNANEFASTVTHYPAGSASGSSITALKVDFDDPGDPTPELRAARFHVRIADVADPKQGDRILDADSDRWFAMRVDHDSALTRMECRKATPCTYTTAEGVSSSIDVIYRFFVGALDVRENALVIVSPDDIANPNEGDIVTITGDSNEWAVNDVRERAGLFELRVIRTKERS